MAQSLIMKNHGTKASLFYSKKSTGFYFLLEFQAEGDAVNKLEVELKKMKGNAIFNHENG